MLENITRACEDYRPFYSKTFIFRASFPPDEVIVNQKVDQNLFWLEWRPVRYVVWALIH